MLLIIFWLVLLIAGAVAVVTKIARCKRPFRTALTTSLSGLAAMVVVNLLGSITGVSIAFNYMTVSCAVVLGLPGTIMLLIMKLLG